MRGDIHSLPQYMQGKWLKHSSWLKGNVFLRDYITPSDIDAAFDNKGLIIFCEFSSSKSKWPDIDRGQRMLYESAISGSLHVAALCRHCVPGDQQIDTRNDIKSAQIMLDHNGKIIRTPIFTSVNFWPAFVLGWYRDPMATRERLIEAWAKVAA